MVVGDSGEVGTVVMWGGGGSHGWWELWMVVGRKKC